jgi:hypothetical protein
MQMNGPRCMKASRGPLVFASAEDLILAPRFAKDVSGLQQLSSKIASHVAFTRSDLGSISNCRRCRSSGCLANDRPLTHTVTCTGKVRHISRVDSFDLLAKSDPADECPRPLLAA